MRNNILIALSCMLAGLLILTACPSPDGDGTGTYYIDTSALQAKITEAKGLHDATAVPATDNGEDVPLGTYWVNQQTKIQFQTAIAAANGVLSFPVSQNNVNNAVTVLENRIEQFKNARQPGNAVPVNKTALLAKIAEAEFVKIMAVVDTDAANVARGRYWVTAGAMDTFDAAITTAKKALTTASTQTMADNAVSALSSAISAFTNGRLKGMKTAGFTKEEIDSLIAAANDAKARVKTSADDGEDVGPAEYWVSQNVLDDLNSAISTAQAASGNFDRPYLALVNVLNDFDKYKSFGKTPDKDSLIDAIRDADTVKTGVVVATRAARAPYGSKWATEAQWQPFNTAYRDALTAINDPNATKNDVDATTNALTDAIYAFYSAVEGNGPGTRQNSVTINGLNSFPNGTSIQLRLFSSADISSSNRSGIHGEETVQNGTVTVSLYNTDSSGGSSWAGGGSWYAAFIAENEQVYISKSAINFTAAPNAVTNFSDYRKYVYKYKFGDIAEMTEIYIPAAGITLDAWCLQLSGGTMDYDQMIQAGEIPGPICTNESLTQPFSGSDTLYADTMMYSAFELPIGGGSPGAKIGEISGTITLTNIPSPAPRVSISVSGDNWSSRDRQINLNSVTDTSATLNWTIPLYDNNGFYNNGFSPSEGYFYLRVEPSGSSRFQIEIPGSKFISSETAYVGSLGTVSLSSITLSGTINVTYENLPVPRVEISAYSGDKWLGSTEITSPRAGASWSIPLQGFNSSTPVYFKVYGYGPGTTLFSTQPALSVNVNNANIRGITLNPGNIINPNTPVNPVQLTANTWKDGDITKSGDVHWYSISVTDGTKYYLWWNDKDDGDGSKTLDIDVYAYDSGNKPISLGSNDSAWHDPVSFTASSSGTVYARVRAVNDEYPTGTYSIVYSTGSTRPAVPIVAIRMTEDTWANGKIITPSGEQWFKFTATAATQYIHVNFGTLYELYVQVYNTSVNPVGNEKKLYGNATFTPQSSLTVGQEYYIKAWQYSDGTYQLAFNTSRTAPLPWKGAEVTPLTNNTWRKNDSITEDTPNSEIWYSLEVTGGTTYYVWWNDSYDGNNTQTLDVVVTCYYPDGSYIFYADSAWTTPQSFTAGSGGTVRLKVSPYFSDDTGGFAIAYRMNWNIRPTW